ncbi:MAG: FAD-dependent thymidylate synthase [Draconibacterium sp.]|nr:FAD-dependent thymidylate synthase [Draconibacterium sp.]
MKAKLNWWSDNWEHILNGCRSTLGKGETNKQPSSQFKQKLILSEHSPIRKLCFDITIKNLKSWASVHLVRHKHGIEHMVQSQRDDIDKNITKQKELDESYWNEIKALYAKLGIEVSEDRDASPQSMLIQHNIFVNAQCILNICKKRFCTSAHPYTRKLAEEISISIADVCVELYNACVPNCVYRGGICHEFKQCGYNQTELFKNHLDYYVNLWKDVKKPYYMED